MALISIDIAATTFGVILTDTTSTDCANIYTYEVSATNADTIDITVTNNATNSYYVSNGVTTFFSSTASVAYDTSLIVKFSIENSGNPGFFNSVDLSIENTTTAEAFTLFEDTVTRESDDVKCVGAIGNISGVLQPQLFNPSGGEVISGAAVFALSNTTDIVFITINGQVLNNDEYSLTTNMLTVNPDNGFYDITDEVLVFQTAP